MNDIIQALKTVKEIKKNCKPQSKCDTCEFHIGIFGDGYEGCIFKRGVPGNWLGEDFLLSYYEDKKKMEGAE